MCGPVKCHTVAKNSALNPVLIVEVLSPATEAYDRGAKFGHYKKIASLTEYVLASSDRVHIEHFVRLPDGNWMMEEQTGLDAVVELASVGSPLALRDVYAKTDLVAPLLTEPSPRPPGVGRPIGHKRNGDSQN